MISLRINSKPYKVQENTTILEACKSVGIYIPSICSHSILPPLGVCGLCIVKIDGQAYCYSCMTKVKSNMVIDTDSEDVLAKAKKALDKFIDMSQPPSSPEIEELFNYIYQRKPIRLRVPERTNSLEYHPDKCLNCNRCVSMCADILQIDALSDNGLSIKNSSCISCGLCCTVCPTNSMRVVNSTSQILRALASGKIMALIVDPNVNFTVGEMMGDSVGAKVTGKIISAAKMLGFKLVFNSGFALDLSIMKHAEELDDRLNNKKNLPLFNSNCPSFVNFIEKFQSNKEIMPLLKPLRSPHMILARHMRSTTKTSNLFIASLTGCVGAKEEVKRMQAGNDIDAVITVPEFVEMLKSFGVEWVTLKNDVFDQPYDENSSASYISSVSGGFTEAVLRSLQVLNNEKPTINLVKDFFPKNIVSIDENSNENGQKDINNDSNRNENINSNIVDKNSGTKIVNTSVMLRNSLKNRKNITTGIVKIGAKEIRICICNGIGAVREIIDSGDYKDFDFVEAFACPGGCVYGGGQPMIKNTYFSLQRAESVYKFYEKNNNKKTPYDNTSLNSFLLSLMKEDGTVNSSSTSSSSYSTPLSPNSQQTNTFNSNKVSINVNTSLLNRSNNNTTISNIITVPSNINNNILSNNPKRGKEIRSISSINGINSSMSNSSINQNNNNLSAVGSNLSSVLSNNNICASFSNGNLFVNTILNPEKILYTHLEPQQSAISIVRKKNQFLPIVAFAGGTRESGFARLISNLMKCSSMPMNNIDNINQLKSRKTCIFIVKSSKNQLNQNNLSENDNNASKNYVNQNNSIKNNDNDNNSRQYFPRNGRKFLKMLKENPIDLTDVNYSIFCIGNKKTLGNDLYGISGDILDNLLTQRNAKPILPLVKSDEDLDDGGMSAYIDFSHTLSKALFLKKPLVGVELINKLVEIEDKSIIEKPARPLGFEMATMVERELLSPEGQIPAMHRYLIRLPEGMSYEVGDHVTVLARNDDDIVANVMKLLKYNPNSVFSIDNSSDKMDNTNLIPQKISVLQLFTQYLDLNCAPTRSLLRAFYDCSNEEGKAKLEPLLDEANPSAFNEYLKDVNVFEFIEEFSQYGIPPVAQMVSATPHIVPRIYSIASAPDMNRGYLELVVLDVHFGPNLHRYGITTHFLARPDLGQLAIHCMRGIFHYPSEVDTPIIMIALGGGISPMFSLIQYRMSANEDVKKNLGPAQLFFGSKYRGAYPLLNKKLNNFYATGIVQELFVAYSRDGPKRVHVQDLMKEQSSKLWELWQNPKTQLFYCGPARSVPEEIKDIMLKITINEGYLSIEEAMAFNSRHEFHIEGYQQ